ncbi:MAG TPA: outer membrane beta-barrel domain-containing protein [Pseudobdellovibrionaceae bacterium]|jgi:outer membrane beta-barrel protein
MIKNALKGLSFFLSFFLNFFLVAFFLQSVAFATEVVELPTEELATESVYPVFDKPVSVKNRNIITAGRFELGGYYGNALTEPIFNVSKYGLAGYYHVNENHAIGAFFESNAAGLSKYGQQLTDVPGSTAGSHIHLDFTRAPAPQSTFMVDYNFKAFYGKMSLSKSLVFNLTTFGSAAAGFVKYQNKSYLGIALGLGQKYHLSKQFSLRWDLRMFANNAPIPFYSSTGNPYTLDPTDGVKKAPPFDQFSERLTYTTNLNVGVSYMF